jgi:hypothetical protein
MAAFFRGFVDELMQFDFCKQMQTQRIDQIGQVPLLCLLDSSSFANFLNFSAGNS